MRPGIDGANLFQILLRIILPLSMPAIATVAIFTFQFTWNDFLPPLIYLHDQRLYTVALGLNFFRSSFQVSWAYLMAASLVSSNGLKMPSVRQLDQSELRRRRAWQMRIFGPINGVERKDQRRTLVWRRLYFATTSRS